MLSDAMERRLTPMAWLKLRLHLAICGMCRAYAGDLRILAAALGRLHDRPVGPEPRLTEAERTQMLARLMAVIDGGPTP
jgi:hypothetical protein